MIATQNPTNATDEFRSSITFTARSGVVTGFRGPNGSGKPTRNRPILARCGSLAGRTPAGVAGWDKERSTAGCTPIRFRLTVQTDISLGTQRRP